MADDSLDGGEEGRQLNPACPFRIRLLDTKTERAVDTSQCVHDQLSSLLPASYRTKSDHLAAAGRHVTACIEKELDLTRLTRIYRWLWIVGLPMPPRPLHYQLLLSREIFITEQMDMHLVWTTGQIFLKPIPRYLLEPFFWTDFLCCVPLCRCPLRGTAADPSSTERCERWGLRRRALGFLFSYAALICYESDFLIAQEKHLLPPEVEWPAWRMFIEELDIENIYSHIDPRFGYGELRLSRLNKIYAISQNTPFRRYTARWNQYKSFFHEYFALLASASSTSGRDVALRGCPRSDPECRATRPKPRIWRQDLSAPGPGPPSMYPILTSLFEQGRSTTVVKLDRLV